MANLAPSPEVHRSRSRSRRRRSSASDGEGEVFKFPKTGEQLPYRPRIAHDSLCEACQDLVLQHFISDRQYIPNASGEFIAYLHELSRRDCTLCVFLASMRIPPPRKDLKGIVDSNPETRRAKHEYHLRVFSGSASYREYFLRSPNMKRREAADTMLAVVPNGLFSDKAGQQPSAYLETFGSVGYILPVAYSSNAPWLTGRRIAPERIDYPLIQQWLDHCKRRHSCTMRYSRPDRLNMINCDTMEIVTAPSNCNYFALSYVWGQSAAVTPIASRQPSTHLALEELAPVVRDAITVVKSLGKKFLWVDRYCIPQHDAELKRAQIRTMDLIYEGAFCTIIAASGSNDQHGLPGVSISRHAQPSFQWGKHHLVSSLPDPQQAIKTSVWMKRAWTYQEALCSARRLIFTPHQVYFECKVLHCCEAVEIPLSLFPMPGRKRQNHLRPIIFRDEWLQGTHHFGPISAFWNVIKQYSDRQMTYDADALNALEGILRRFQASPSFVYNIFGLPLLLGTEEDKESLLSTDLFISSLSWHHCRPPRRRAGFPSWTWAGWEGSIESQSNFGGLQYASDMKVTVQTTRREKMPWELFWDGFWTPDGKTICYSEFHCLELEASVLKVKLVPPPVHHTHHHPSAKGAVFDMMSPYDGAKYSSVVLPVDLLGCTRTKAELWDCAILGWKAKSDNPDVMLLRWIDGIAERIWAGTLWSHKVQSGSFRALQPRLLRKKFSLR